MTSGEIMRLGRCKIFLAVFSLVLCFAAPASALDLYGPAATGMAGAYRAVATDSSAIIYNPAGISQITRYTADINYYSDSRFEDWYGVSAIDTATSELGAGVSYNYRKSGDKYGNVTSHLGVLSLTESYSKNFYFGVNTKYMDLSWEETVIVETGEGEAETIINDKDKQLFTTDLGMLFRLGQPLSLAIVGYNLTNPNPDFLPLQAAVGLAYSPLENITLATDVVWEDNGGNKQLDGDFGKFSGSENFFEVLDYYFGLDIMFYKSIHLRGGYAMEKNPEIDFFGAGLAWNAPKIVFSAAMQKDTRGMNYEKYVFSVDIAVR
jgi:hypothetical protein